MADDGWPNAGTKVTVRPTYTLRAPAFHTTYPRIINADLLDPGARAAMEASWTKGWFEERNIEVFHLKNAYVIDENLVIDRDLQVVANVDDEYSAEEIERALDDIRQQNKAGTLPHFAGVGVVAKRRATDNYGHYMLYMLPLAALGKRLFEDRNPRYLAHRTSPPMQDVVLRSFRLLGIDLERVLIKDFHEPVLFEELVFFTGLASHGTYMSPLAVQAVVEMAAPIPAGPHRKIFVRRVPGWRRGRLMHNEEDIARRLTARGFQVVDPGALSLEEQISVFKGAEHVVGSVGAGMANIVFCQPGTNVTCLSSGLFPDTFFWFIAMHRPLNYLDIRGDRLTYDDPESWQAGFAVRDVDIRRLESLAGGTEEPPSTARAIDDVTEHTRVRADVHAVGDVHGRSGDWMRGDTHAPASTDGPDDRQVTRAFREGRNAAVAGSQEPNPYPWNTAEFPAWFAGYFAHRRAPKQERRRFVGLKSNADVLVARSAHAITQQADRDGLLGSRLSHHVVAPAQSVELPPVTVVTGGPDRPDLTNYNVIPLIDGRMQEQSGVVRSENVFPTSARCPDMIVARLNDVFCLRHGLLVMLESKTFISDYLIRWSPHFQPVSSPGSPIARTGPTPSMPMSSPRP